MDKNKKERLESSGWVVGDTQDFLDLSEEEMRLIDLKVKLASKLRERRSELGWTQRQLAQKIHSSQSRIAKIEKGENSVSIDLILKSLYAMDTADEEIAETFVHF